MTSTFGFMDAHIKQTIFTLKFHNVGTIMTLFGLFGVWLLEFWNVQSKISPENGLLSDVNVKNLLQRIEYLKVEKEETIDWRKQWMSGQQALNRRNRCLMRDGKGMGKNCKNIRMTKKSRGYLLHSKVLRRLIKRKFGISKKNHSVAESVLQRKYLTNFESRVFFFDKKVEYIILCVLFYYWNDFWF